MRALKRAMFDRFSTLAVLLVVPSFAFAAPTWVGNFETGDLSQWGSAQRVSEDRLRVVPQPTFEGRYALAASVSQGDDPIGASGNRAELVSGRLEPDGSEAWYRWAVMFPEDFPASPKWQLFTQWHHDGCCGSPPVEFHVTNEQLTFTVQGRALWRTPLQRGVWHELMLHVRWSADPALGFSELWYDGAQVLPRTAVATALPGMRNYLKVGYYRDASIQPSATVYLDGMVQGATREDVDPPPATAPEAPADGAVPDAGPVALPLAPHGLPDPGMAPTTPSAGTVTSPSPPAPSCGGVPVGAFTLLALLASVRRARAASKRKDLVDRGGDATASLERSRQ